MSCYYNKKYLLNRLQSNFGKPILRGVTFFPSIFNYMLSLTFVLKPCEHIVSPTEKVQSGT